MFSDHKESKFKNQEGKPMKEDSQKSSIKQYMCKYLTFE